MRTRYRPRLSKHRDDTGSLIVFYTIIGVGALLAVILT
jgi:hypothetical protein